jgi:hypothetical protein
MPLFTTTLSLQPPSDLDLDVRYHRALDDEIAELEPDQLQMPCSLTAGLYRIRVTLDAVDERAALERARKLVDVAARRARRPVHPEVTADIRRVSE